MIAVNDRASLGIIQAINDLYVSATQRLEGLTGLSQEDIQVSSAAVAGTAVTGAVLGLSVAPITTLGLGFLATFGTLWIANKSQNLNLVLIAPLSRFSRPWIGGLQGYEIGDLWTHVGNKWERFKEEEITPLLESYRLLRWGTVFFGKQRPSPQQCFASPATAQPPSEVEQTAR